MHVIAAKAVAFKEALSNDFVSYQKQVIANAKHLANFLNSNGNNIVSGGTDTHEIIEGDHYENFDRLYERLGKILLELDEKNDS